MQSKQRIPGNGAAAAHRPELYRELWRRNERRARVAPLLQERREWKIRIDRVIQPQRAHRFRGTG